jgi:hypothetical protein
MSQIGRQLVKFFQGELLKKTGEAARFQKGNVVPFTRVTEIQPNVRPAAAPAREVMRTSPGQLELPLGGVRAVRPTTMPARNVPMGRPAPEPNFRTSINPAPKPEFTVNTQALTSADIPVDVAFGNAAGGVQQLDLGSLLRRAGLVAASAGTMAGSAALVNAFRPDAEQAQTPMGQPTASPETGPLTPAVTGIVEASFSPMGAGQQLPSPGFMGTPAARTRQSELIQAIQQAKAASTMPSMPGTPTAENYPDIAAYYAQRERYTNQPNVARALVGELAQQDPRYSEADIRTWAGSNPELTYELLERMKGNRAMPSQQMPQARGVEISTPMGTNFTNNALGSASAAVGAAFGSQGAADIEATVTPQFVESLQPLPPNYQKALSRARIPMGY